MASSREPLRAFRDKSAAKSAAKKARERQNGGARNNQEAEVREGGTVKNLAQIGDKQYGGTLNSALQNKPTRSPPSTSAAGSNTLPRDPLRSSREVLRVPAGPGRAGGDGGELSLSRQWSAGSSGSGGGAPIDFAAIAAVASAMVEGGHDQPGGASLEGLTPTGTLPSGWGRQNSSSSSSQANPVDVSDGISSRRWRWRCSVACAERVSGHDVLQRWHDARPWHLKRHAQEPRWRRQWWWRRRNAVVVIVATRRRRFQH